MELQSPITDEYFGATDYTPLHYENLVDLYETYQDEAVQWSSSQNEKFEAESFIDCNHDISPENSNENIDNIVNSSPLKLPSPVKFTTLESPFTKGKQFNIESILSKPKVSSSSPKIQDVQSSNTNVTTSSNNTNTILPNPSLLTPAKCQLNEKMSNKYQTQKTGPKFEQSTKAPSFSKKKEKTKNTNRTPMKFDTKHLPQTKYYIPYTYHQPTEYVAQKLCYIPAVQHTLYSHLSLPYDKHFSGKEKTKSSRNVEILPRYNYSYHPKSLQHYNTPINNRSYE